MEPLTITELPTLEAFRRLHDHRFRDHPTLQLVLTRKRVRKPHVVIGGNDLHQVIMLGTKDTRYHAILDELDHARVFLFEPVYLWNHMMTLVGGVVVLNPHTSTVQATDILPHSVGNFDSHDYVLTYSGTHRNVWVYGRLLLLCCPWTDGVGMTLTGMLLDPDTQQPRRFRHVVQPIHDDNNTYHRRGVSPRFAYYSPRWLVMTFSATSHLALDLDGFLHPEPFVRTHALASVLDVATLDAPPRYVRMSYPDHYPAHCIRCERETVHGYMELQQDDVTIMHMNLGRSTCRFCWIRYSPTVNEWKCWQCTAATRCDMVVTAKTGYVCPTHGDTAAPVYVSEENVVLARRRHAQLTVDVYL